MTNEMSYPEEGGNALYGYGDAQRNALIDALTKDHGTLAAELRMSAMSRQEQADRLKGIEVGQRHGITSIILRHTHSIIASAGRDGRRADQVVAIGTQDATSYHQSRRAEIEARSNWWSFLQRSKQDPSVRGIHDNRNGGGGGNG